MRGGRPSKAALAVTWIVLAQLVGCSSCVKEEEQPATQTVSPSDRPVKPLMKGIDQKLTQFSTDASTSD